MFKKYTNFLLIAFVLAMGLAVWGLRHNAAGPQSLEASAEEKAFVADLAKKGAAIAGNLSFKASSRSDAGPLRDMITKKDFGAATRLMRDSVASSKIRTWTFEPFGTLADNIGKFTDNEYGTALNAWVQQDKENPFPHLLRAQYLNAIGWAKRGNFTLDKTDKANMDQFVQYNEDAINEINEAIRLDPNDPSAYVLKQRIVGGIEGEGADTEAAFNEAIGRFPNFYPFYSNRLNTLAPKWGGTVPKMYLFVQQYAAAEHSPLKVLYFQLYDDLMDAAKTPCFGIDDSSAWRGCVLKTASKIVLPEVKAGMVEALDLYNYVDQEDYNDEFLYQLDKVSDWSSFDQLSASIIEIAAEKTGSDNQMVENNPGHNDYMMDLIVGGVWELQENYANAALKYKEALQDLAHAPFKDENARAQRAAYIMTRVSSASLDGQQFPDAITYDLAASQINSDPSLKHIFCFAYYKLSYLATALQECTKAVDLRNSLTSRFWRAEIYKKMKNNRAAEEDYTQIANSDWDDKYVQISAATDAAILLGERLGSAAALDFYQKHPYMFDERYGSKEELSISYNNRCYALMQVKEYQRALEDCNKSLTYGILPDAVNKRQQLMKILSVPAKNL